MFLISCRIPVQKLFFKIWPFFMFVSLGAHHTIYHVIRMVSTKGNLIVIMFSENALKWSVTRRNLDNFR